MISHTSSSRETKVLGEEFARSILKSGAGSSARVIALTGDLGAGKTTFVQGFFRGLGIRRPPASPTFIIMRRAALKKGPFKNVFHLDAYRLESGDELRAIGFEDILRNPANLVLIEWADRVPDIIPRNAYAVRFAHGPEESSRSLDIP